MKQAADRRSEANLREILRPGSVDRPTEPETRNRKVRNAAAAPRSFTSQMLDYRSWWNLPGPKTRKTHG
jgi:hypothetical protein